MVRHHEEESTQMAADMNDGPTVVVIDDEESMREGCRQTLEEKGYRTSVAENGEEGSDRTCRKKVPSDATNGLH